MFIYFLRTLENNSQEMPADIKKSVQQMVRSILTLTTTLQPLPEGCELTMKLEFNDEGYIVFIKHYILYVKHKKKLYRMLT